MPSCATAVVVISNPAGSDRFIDMLGLGVTEWVTACHLLDTTQAAMSAAIARPISKFFGLFAI